ncbi:MAG: hypothetical protein Q8L06_06045, partial [Pseudohongiella sp.]|nr:hypothetical protein [Pseudohongiella sp.]
MNQAKSDCVEIIRALEWMKVFDFCERLHGHLARRIATYDPFLEDERVHVEKSDIQEYISTELQRLFLEERLGYEFTDGQVRRAGRKHTIDLTTKAQVVLGDPRLATARTHYQKALQFFRSPSHPDYANSVKESVCAVEAAGRELFPNSKAKTLGELAAWFQKTTEVSMPKSLAKIIGDVYGYRNGGDGVAHGGASGGQPTAEVAEFILSVCASQIIYLVDLANSLEEDLPF